MERHFTAIIAAGRRRWDDHRRLTAALLVGVAVVAGLSALSPQRAAQREVWTARHDLAGGGPLSAGDVVLRRLTTTDVPSGAFSATANVVGRLLTGPLRQGEVITDAHLLGPALLAAISRPGLVAVPVRLADADAAAALVHVGDLVDILAIGDPAGDDAAAAASPRVVAPSVAVLTVPVRDSSGDGAGVVVVAVTRVQADALAAAAATSRLSLALRHP